MDFKLDQKILIVDDAHVMRKIIHMMMKELGFTNVHFAENGAEAFFLIQKSHNTGVNPKLI